MPTRAASLSFSHVPLWRVILAVIVFVVVAFLLCSPAVPS